MMIYSIQISVIKPCPRSLFIRYLKIFTIYIFIRINSENSTKVSKYIVRIRSGSVLKLKMYITSLYEPRIYSKWFSNPKNSLKSYTDHFGQLLKNSIFRVSVVSGPTGLITFPGLFFQMSE